MGPITTGILSVITIALLYFFFTGVRECLRGPHNPFWVKRPDEDE